jgi:UDP-N-acetylmuramoylalanine--D-glutamate ligase
MTKLHQHLTQKYADKKILILGFGREGKSTYKILRECFPDKQIFISDNQKINVTEFADENLIWDDKYLQNLAAYEVIFKTPGISFREPELQQVFSQTMLITSQLREFLEVYAKQTIGVTGTKGKSTTATLIFHIFQTAKKPVVLVGNIGIPVFDRVQDIHEETLVAVEMSSYQLEVINTSPHIGVFLNFFPEHINYHQSLENYLAAKANITQFQTTEDFFIYNDDSEDLKRIAQNSEANKKAFSQKAPNFSELEQFLGQSVKDFTNLNQVIIQNSLLPAFFVAQLFHTSAEKMSEAFSTFQSLPHRLQNIGQFRGITFYDDTLATIPQATSLAINTISRVGVLILGGYDRGLDYTHVVETIIEKSVPTLVLFRPSGQKIFDLLQEKYKGKLQLPLTFFVESMEDAVKIAFAQAKEKQSVLLSPASPSFGQFKDYEDKSNQFVHWVHKLGAE